MCIKLNTIYQLVDYSAVHLDPKKDKPQPSSHFFWKMLTPYNLPIALEIRLDKIISQMKPNFVILYSYLGEVGKRIFPNFFEVLSLSFLDEKC